MGSFSIWHWLIVAIVLLLLFGKGRFSEMMGDVAKGIKSFKKGMSEDEEAAASAHAAQQRRIAEGHPAQPHVMAPQPPTMTPQSGDVAGGAQPVAQPAATPVDHRGPDGIQR